MPYSNDCYRSGSVDFSQFVIPGILFLVNPLFGLIISLVMVVKATDDYDQNREAIIYFLIISALWISLINITKFISGDQGVYARLFLNVPTAGFHGTVFGAWGGTGKEPLYSFITWSCYWLTGGNLRIFFLSLSFAMYMFMFMATYELYRATDRKKDALICGILIITFFSQYFVMSLHLIRQMLAASIVTYALVYRAIYGKNNWFLLVASVLIHTSAIFVAGLSMIPWLYEKLTKKRMMIILGGFVPIIAFNGYVASFIGGSTGIDAINYGLSRFGESGASDGGIISMGIVMMVFVPLALSCFHILKVCNLEADGANDGSGESAAGISMDNQVGSLRAIVYVCILLMIFVLSFTKSPLIQYRFFYYSYSFIPLLLPLLFTKEPMAKIYWSLSSLFFILRFFITHNHSGWRYASVMDIFIQPVSFYFTGNFHWMYNI